jgi:hypothetical protein
VSKLEVFLLVVAIAQLVFVIEFVRRRKLLEGFAVLWIAVGFGGLGLVVARSLIDRIADAVGIAYGASLVLALGIAFLLLVCMSLSLHVSKLETRVEVLAAEVAFLRGVREPVSQED